MPDLLTETQISSTAREKPAVAPPAGHAAVTVAVLRVLADIDQAMGVNAIARELGMAPSSCFKVLKQLQASGFADFDPETKCYSLGAGAVMLARQALDPHGAFALAQMRLEAAARTHDVAIGLWRRISRARIILTGFVEGGGFMRVHMAVGQRLPMLIGGVGRSIAAKLELPNEQMRHDFAKLRWETPLDFKDYCAQVETARRTGYAIDRNTFARGVTTIASAVRAPSGAVHYALSGATFSARQSEETMAALGRELASIADETPLRQLPD